ncbi:hypothetical protein [Alteribacter aurantiacus]|uniref:hypothetical protein n=1 Tax=Alteribacter aurantiacus TaxID=254410 RepID=UPI0006847883|nr:hypothetical protein [Alteribacter aurantiacus]
MSIKKRFTSKIILFTVFVLLFSSIGSSFSTFANSNSQVNFEDDFFEDQSSLEHLLFEDLEELGVDELKELGVAVHPEAEDFNEDILAEDFDVEDAVYDLDISKMDEEEREEFLQIIEEAAAISGTTETELLEEALISIFDSESETFNDLEATQEVLEEKYVEKIESEELALISFSKILFLGSDKVYASNKNKGKVRVGVYLAGSVFNVAIGGIVGGGVSAVKSYIKKKGKKAAADTLSRVVTAQAKKLKIQTVRGVAIASVVGTAVYVTLDYADIGVAVAKFIDSKDWYRNNGWIDITQ